MLRKLHPVYSTISAPIRTKHFQLRTAEVTMMHQSSSLLCFWLHCFAFQRFCCMLVRENLDPMGSASDDQLWGVLEKCHMKRAVIAAGQGLSLVVSEGGDSLSLGQWQLLCLARSLLSTACVSCPQLSLSNIHPQSISYDKTLIHKL